jgi:hypothetical protein
MSRFLIFVGVEMNSGNGGGEVDEARFVGVDGLGEATALLVARPFADFVSVT